MAHKVKKTRLILAACVQYRLKPTIFLPFLSEQPLSELARLLLSLGGSEKFNGGSPNKNKREYP